MPPDLKRRKETYVWENLSASSFEGGRRAIFSEAQNNQGDAGIRHRGNAAP